MKDQILKINILVVLLLALIFCGHVGASAVALWLFEEGSGTTVNDASGNGNTATFGSPPNDPQWITGKYGNAVSNDQDDSIRVSDSSSLDVTSGLTIECWINFNGQYANGDILYKWPLGDRSYCFSIWGATGNKLRLIGRIQKVDNSDQVHWDGSQEIPVLGWHHVAFTYDGATGVGKLYIDGVPESPTPSTSYVGDIRAGGGTMYLCWGNSMGVLAASIDEMRISDQALPAGSGNGVDELAWNKSLNPDAGLLVTLGNGWTLFSAGERTPVNWSDCKIKKDGLFYSINEASNLGWIQSTIYYFDEAFRIFRLIPGDDDLIYSDRGYWIWSSMGNMELLLP
jgi:Concanavalin A-like lectin/glucanases superfamily